LHSRCHGFFRLTNRNKREYELFYILRQELSSRKTQSISRDETGPQVWRLSREALIATRSCLDERLLDDQVCVRPIREAFRRAPSKI
jgi:hypothetical protein